jgi:MoaA/NifB/PqqE/SkfB family radical SAM enzyme
MNRELRRFFINLFRVCLKRPKTALFILKTIRRQKKLLRLREKWENQGIHVPPYLIASITQCCNLKCKGCYAHAKKAREGSELTDEKWGELFSQAKELGISVIMLAGGEPFMRKNIIFSCSDFPEIIFPVFTNGLLLDEAALKTVKHTQNIVPVVSIEGSISQTDERRGDGVFDTVMEVIRNLKANNVFFGLSITLTRDNFDTVTGEGFLKTMTHSGCKLFFLVEYVPVEEGSQNLVLLGTQKEKLKSLTTELRKKYKGVFVSFPGDESIFGGCLAAGRGFVHVSPSGSVEPCPFAPYSDTNLCNMTLKQALQSQLLETIRDNHGSLTENNGGCALWANREWVQSLVNTDDKIKL